MSSLHLFLIGVFFVWLPLMAFGSLPKKGKRP